MTTDRTAWLALAALTQPGNHEVGTLVRSAGPVQALDQLRHNEDLSPALAAAANSRHNPSYRSSDSVDRIASDMLHRADRVGARIITPADDEWPRSLDDLAAISRGTDPLHRDTDPPMCLWLRGPARLAEALDRSVSVVGARAVTQYGEFVASELAYRLAERGWAVVSGGALGIDVTAHRGALAAGGVTCAVLACGIDQVYPVSNSAMFERIAEEGLLITEWPPGTRPDRARFLTRNRIIAAATRGTVMVEAASRSGARNTLGYARRLERSAMAVPGPVTSALSVGCHLELRVPGTVLVTRVEEIVEEIGRIGALTEPTGGEKPSEDG
ncbi:DNA-processing protein DprA [Dactylosporangium maewongense]|uniref:DNA-processing protein DprA n=1 Tax=Dactylosporangium maewongense TaxID=634393 RepID=A0ABP4PJH8_9ACTN